MNVAIFHALKPGGVFVVIDHMAPAGTTDAQIDKLHRIDPDVVKREVKAAGFTLEVDSNLLANPADPLSANVFDASIKGRTSQFVLKFRKP
jgi:predicted methyltransferase